MTAEKLKLFVVEHLDPELEQWSSLEYKTIALESAAAHAQFLLSSVPKQLEIPASLKDGLNILIEQRSVDEIFHDQKASICLLDPAATQELRPEDGDIFDIFLFGGILGDDPPRDRTAELRKQGFQGRRLGPVQMTTDTAVRVTRMVVQGKTLLTDIPYIDFPEIKIDKYESTQMPFRYVKGQNGLPLMPEGMTELIKEDAEKGVRDLL